MEPWALDTIRGFCGDGRFTVTSNALVVTAARRTAAVSSLGRLRRTRLLGVRTVFRRKPSMSPPDVGRAGRGD
jgi:hypothetical protein